MPGETLAQNILDAQLLNVLQLVIVLFVLAIVLLVAAILAMMYYNSQAVAKMSGTQQNMSLTHAQMMVADGEKTKVMQGSLDELRTLRQDFGNSAIMLASTKAAIDTHAAESAGYVKDIEKAADARQQALADHIKTTTAQNLTDLIGATEGIVGKSTEKIVEAVLQALGAIRENLESAQKEYRQKMEDIGDQVARTQQQFIQAIKIDVGGGREDIKQVDGGGHSDTVLSAGAASGSANGIGTGSSDGLSGTAGS